MIKKLFKWAFFLFLAFIGLAIFIGSNMTPEEKAKYEAQRQAEAAAEAEQKATQAKQEADSMELVQVSAIAKAYNDNTVAADQLYKGKKLKVQGTVAEISTNIMGDPYLQLRGGVNQFMEPQMHFDKGAADQLAKLKKGQQVTAVCEGSGDIGKTPMLNDCSLL